MEGAVAHKVKEYSVSRQSQVKWHRREKEFQREEEGEEKREDEKNEIRE